MRDRVTGAEGAERRTRRGAEARGSPYENDVRDKGPRCEEQHSRVVAGMAGTGTVDHLTSTVHEARMHGTTYAKRAHSARTTTRGTPPRPGTTTRGSQYEDFLRDPGNRSAIRVHNARIAIRGLSAGSREPGPGARHEGRMHETAYAPRDLNTRITIRGFSPRDRNPGPGRKHKVCRGHP